MTNSQLEKQIVKVASDLAWWQAKLAKSRKAGKIGTRAVHVSWNERELARLKGIEFARHCNEQV